MHASHTSQPDSTGVHIYTHIHTHTNARYLVWVVSPTLGFGDLGNAIRTGAFLHVSWHRKLLDTIAPCEHNTHTTRIARVCQTVCVCVCCTQITSCMASLMDRLAKYAASDKAVMSQLLSIQAFDRFRDAIAHVIAAQVRAAHTHIHRSPADTQSLPATAAYLQCAVRGTRMRPGSRL